MIFFKFLLGTATIAIILFNIVKGFTSVKKEEVLYTDSEIQLSNETNTSISITWQSQEAEIGSVQYGMIENIYYQSTSEQLPTNEHILNLESLKECTLYYYHVSSESMLFDNEDGNFTTLCEKGKIPHE